MFQKYIMKKLSLSLERDRMGSPLSEAGHMMRARALRLQITTHGASASAQYRAAPVVIFEDMPMRPDPGHVVTFYNCSQELRKPQKQ